MFLRNQLEIWFAPNINLYSPPLNISLLLEEVIKIYIFIQKNKVVNII